MMDFGHPLSIASAMVGFDRPWCIAGGWALDLWLGRETRLHGGVKIAVLRDHQIELRNYLNDWKFQIITLDGRLVQWKDRQQMLMLPVTQLIAKDGAGEQCAVWLQESDGIDWMFRTNFDVRMNLARWIVEGTRGLPVMHPALVLFGKSQVDSQKNELDFRSVVERMDEAQREWLKVALLRNDPFHQWIDQL